MMSSHFSILWLKDETSLCFYFLKIFIYFYVFIWLCHVLVEACRTQLPKQGSNPASLHWECRVLAIGPPGKFLCSWSELHLVLLARSTPSRRTIFRAQLQRVGNSCKCLWQSETSKFVLMIQNIFIGPQTLGHSLGFPRKENLREKWINNFFFWINNFHGRF